MNPNYVEYLGLLLMNIYIGAHHVHPIKIIVKLL